MRLSLVERMDACCAEAVSTGYFTEDMLRRHKIGWFGRFFFIFGMKRDPNWTYWYHHAKTGVDFSWLDVIELQVDRSGLELRWCPTGDKR